MLAGGPELPHQMEEMDRELRMLQQQVCLPPESQPSSGTSVEIPPDCGIIQQKTPSQEITSAFYPNSCITFLQRHLQQLPSLEGLTATGGGAGW